jgi:type I restriction enzyme, S subunit
VSVALSSLGDEATIIMGQSPPGESYNQQGSGAPLLNGPTEFGPVHPVEKQWTTSPTKFCEAGDVLFCVRGATAGRLNLANKEYCIGRGLAAIRGKAGKFDSGFLRYVLANGYATFQSRGVGSTFINISGDELARFPVPALPLVEQRRIAEVLDRAEALRAKRRAALAQIDSLTQSLFLDIFGDPVTNPKGWPIRRIGDLLESASYGTSEKSGATGEFPVLRMNNITRTGAMDFSDLKFMDLEASEYDRYLVRRGDVLFNRTNSVDLVGKTGIFRETEPMAYAGYLIRLRTNDVNDPEYLSAFLNTGYAKRMLRGMCKSIIGMANINATEIQGMKIPQTPLKLQREFARRVSAVEKLKAAQRASLAELDALFDSLQHSAFKGEL